MQKQPQLSSCGCFCLFMFAVICMNIANFDRYRYKYDMHVHTSPVSKCADFPPQDVVRFYSELGFDGIVITNHFSEKVSGRFSSDEEFLKSYLRDFYDARKYGEKYGLDVILGMEMRFPENKNEYLVYGISPDDVYRAYDYVCEDYETFYKKFKSEENLIIQAHPYRSVCTLQRLDIIDGIEVFNMHPGHNSGVAVAAKLANENPQLIVTGGTDFHHEGHQGMCALCTDRRITDSHTLSDVLKSRNYIFDIWGNKVVPTHNNLQA